MPLIPKDQLERLRHAIRDKDFLHRIIRKVEQLHRVVFNTEELDRMFVRASAEEILIADIMTRHNGEVDGVYFALRKVEERGKSWDQAIVEFASYIHSYYTTPLGVVLCRDLFGDDCHFVTPAAGRYSGRQGPAAQKSAT
ncbi:MAG TPA: hypothetical protein VMV94_04285 [Phycisphaerae bacterium]|nr:hypothetical protein [Phycisphaerae bacterium]